MSLVERLHVALADVAHRARQGVPIHGRQEQMHMVAHEDVGVNADMVLRHRLAQKLIEVPAIEVVDEDRAAIDAALSAVKGSTCKLEARATWHAH